MRNMHGKELKVTPTQQPGSNRMLPAALCVSMEAEPSQGDLPITTASADTLPAAQRETLSHAQDPELLKLRSHCVLNC